MTLKKAVFISILFLSLLATGSQSLAADQAAINYRKEMVVLLNQMSMYAREKNPAFEVLGNNGLDLLQTLEGKSNYHEENISSLHGVLMESYFYGWDMFDDAQTPRPVHKETAELLALLESRQRPVFSLDYCKERYNVDKAYRLNDNNGWIAFVADSRQLDSIPHYPQKIHRENSKPVTSLQQAQNLLVLLNPHKFANKRSYLESLQRTNYDLLIIDAYFNNQPLSVQEVNSLKVKKNGASRLVFAYLSVGEAEDYRAYWQPAWSKARPEWIAAENPDWPGNYKVKYWQQEWQRLLFGTANSALDVTLSSGFNGVLLDVIDAYQYFTVQS